MIKKIMSVILTVVMSLSLCTVAFAVDVLEDNYEIFMLPVISDKLPTENQITEIKVYLDKQTDTAFVALEDVCELIGASCSQEDDIYAVQRDAVYFSYNGQGNMELYLLTENSTSVFLDAVAQATGNIIRKNIIGHRLLDGDLFESRKISNQWYVDYIKFCDMFGVKLSKYTSNNHNNLLAIIQELNISLSHDVKFNFDKNPYYVKMYSGTTLSSIYQKVMRNYETYLFDYYALKTKNSDFWDDVTQKLSTMYQLADLQYKNVLSNVINDWNGFTSALLDQYEPGEHYTESLLNILNSNYLEYVIKNSSSNNELPNTFSDFIESFEVFYGSLLEKESNLLSASENVKNFVDYFQALSQNNGDYAKVFQSMAESADSIVDEVFSGLSVAKIMINSVSAFIELNDTCRQINDLSSDKMTFLQKGIFKNEKLVAESSKVNISGVIDKISQTANILYPAGVLNMSSNYVRKALQNSDNNVKGVIDSARKIYDTYGNVGEQNLEKLKEVLKTAVYTELDEGTQQVLSKFPETVPIAVAMSVIDGSMALAKSAIGEELKDAENLVQYYYIEQNLLCNLNEWNPEKLHINLTFALMASLCCYENQKKVMESVFQELESKEINLPKYYFESMEEKRKELDDSINKIAETLYQLDHQKTQLCIDYYHDPRNNNVSSDIVEAILHYNNGTISGRVLTDNNQPIEKAKISVFVFANGIGIGSEEDVYYTDSEGKFSIPVSAKNEYMLQVTCDGYKSADDNEFVKIYPVAVERQEDTYVGDIYMKVPDNTSDNSWRNIYKQFLYNKLDSDKGYGAFDLFDLNDDGIPELFVSDGFGAHVNSCFMYSINDNEISQDICSGQYGELYLDKDIKIVIGVGHTNGRGDKWKIYCKVDSNKNFVVDHFREIPVQYKESFFVNGTEVTKEVYQNKLQEYKRLNTKEIGRTNKLTKENIDYIIDHWGKDNTISEENINGFWREVIVSNTTTAAISQDDELYMWGSNYYGQIGNGTTTEQLTPYKVLSDVKSISLSSTNSAAITNSGELYIWGSNYDGDIGNGIYGAYSSQKNQLIPYKVLSNVKSVSLGLACSAAITNSGELYMWGGNFDGQIGNGTTKNQLTPYKVLNNIKSISLGRNRSAAITDNGDLYMWGSNYYGQIGNGTTKDQLTPYKVLSNVKNIMLEDNDIAAITNDDDLYLWGYNSYGQVGNGTTKDQLTPYKVLGNVRNVSLGYANIATITNNGDLYIWGDNFHGQIGNGTTKDQLTPCKVLSNVKSVSLGHFYNVSAITNNSDLYIWGDNFHGQIGNGTTEDQLTPCKVLSNVKNIMLENYHGAAITNNDDLYMWGENIYGQIGNGTTDSQLTPYKVLSNVKGVLLNSFDSVGITNNDELYTWGFNGYGKIGNGTTDNQFVPYKVTVE